MQGRSRRSAAPSENAASHNDHPPLLPSVEAGKDLVRFIAASPASPAPPRSFVAQRQAPRHIEAQAYLFVRPGSGRALSQGNALGGSQMAARIALPLNADGKIAAAARLYAPLNGKGAEAALGLDLRIDPGTPLRLSVERRQRLDRAGRAAWSAYMAGGVYRALPGRLILDGYAQAGFVGLRSRNLFADGAIRIERTVSPGGVAGGLGGGLWAAAQPGASRIDIGPRASMRLPLGEHAVSLALEGRFRIAGDARPANGVALTLAAAL